MFRSLGAVIDAEDNTAFFKKLQRRIPITLSDRKLYRLDFAELLTSSDNITDKKRSAIESEWICQSTIESIGSIEKSNVNQTGVRYR